MDMMSVLWQVGIFASVLVFGIKIGLASGLANLSKRLFASIFYFFNYRQSLF